MGWDAAIFGEVRFGRGGLAKWTALVTSDEDGDWPDFILGAIEASDEHRGRPVRELLALFERLASSPESRQGVVQFAIAGERLSIRAYVGEDYWRDHGGSVAAILRLAAEVGAKGEVDFINAEELTGDRMTFDGDGVGFAMVDHTEAMMDPRSRIARLMRELWRPAAVKKPKRAKRR